MLFIWSTTRNVPGHGRILGAPRLSKQTPVSNATRFIDENLFGPSPLHGWQEKSAMLEPEKWLYKLTSTRETRVREWLSRSPGTEENGDDLQPPAQVFACNVHINHHYKFIWIRSTKTGGTSTKANIGWVCNDWYEAPKDADMSHCADRVWLDTELTVDAMKEHWREYFVFSIARNPYTRFVSSYKFINSLTPEPCPRHSFAEVCEEPFIHSRTTYRTGCQPDVRMWHDVEHMMEQTHCLFTKDGEIVVDYLGHTEDLTNSYRDISREVNRRLGRTDLRLNDTRPVTIKNTTSKNANQSAISLFEQNPQCLDTVKKYFASDLERLGFTAEQ